MKEWSQDIDSKPFKTPHLLWNNVSIATAPLPQSGQMVLFITPRPVENPQLGHHPTPYKADVGLFNDGEGQGVFPG